MDAFFRELRHSFRRLLKSPGPSLIAVLTMALGIGLCAAMFSIVDTIFLRGLPFEESERLMHLERNNLAEDIESMEVPHHDFEDWVAQQQSFEGLAGFNFGGTINLADEGPPDRYSGADISPGFLSMLRVQPIQGRALLPADSELGAEPVALIGHHVWQKRYGGEPDVVGKMVRINAEPTRIVGILPEGFRFPMNQDVWTPLKSISHEHPRGEGNTLEVFGRLRDGVTVDQAAAEMTTIARRLAEQYPESNEGVGAILKPYLEEYTGDGERRMVGIMLAAVLLVLLIACFNVTNLLLGRAAARMRELAIRAALGSGRWRVMRQVLVDALWISAIGAILGTGLAHFGIRALDAAVSRTDPPFWIVFYLSGQALALTVCITGIAAFAAGLMPALQATRADVNAVLQDSARGSSFRLGRLSRGLVVAEVAISCALLVAAGLMVMSVLEAQRYDLKFDTENLLVARMGLMEADHPEEQDWVRFYDQVLDELRGKAEIESVTVGSVVPVDNAIGAGFLPYERPDEVYESPRQMPFTRWASVHPDYFETLGVEILSGRNFTTADTEGSAPVAIVNEDFARKEWPGESPIGQRVNLWQGNEEEEANPDAGWVEVVGMVPNLRYSDFDNADDQQGIYLPAAQEPTRFTWVIARTRSEPSSFAEPLRRAVLALDPNLPLYYVRPMDRVISESLFFNNLFAVMFSIFALVGLILAAAGLYGVMAFGVTQRTQEIGVRMAFGARARDVLRMVITQGLRQVSLGLAIGLLLALGVSTVLASFLFQVQPRDPMTYAAVALILLLVAVIACLVPARRASGVSPIRALRHE